MNFPISKLINKKLVVNKKSNISLIVKIHKIIIYLEKIVNIQLVAYICGVIIEYSKIL
jgi:hypothetical protein